MKEKVGDIISFILGIGFITISALFSWCACILSSRYEEDNNTNNDNNNDNNVH